MTELEDANKRAEEIQILQAIFANEFHWLGEDQFLISIKNEDSLCSESSISIHSSPGYPSKSPPIYTLETYGLSKSQRTQLEKNLNQIYLENMGTPVIHEWITAIKEFLANTKLEKNEEKDENKLDIEKIDLEKSKKKNEEDEEESYDSSLNRNFEHVAVSLSDKTQYELPEIHHGEFVRDRKSIFQGHLARVFFKEQVDQVMSKLKENKKIAIATHNILAYRIEQSNGGFNSGCADDGEFGAGSRMLHLLNIVDARNVLVVVTRWYGGIHLGGDRFKHINNCTRDLLQMYGYIKEKKSVKTTSNESHKHSKHKKK